MNRFIKGDKVEVISGSHSGLMPGDTGIVENDMGGGYAVYFENTRYISCCGGADKTRAAIVYLINSEIKPANDT